MRSSCAWCTLIGVNGSREEVLAMTVPRVSNRVTVVVMIVVIVMAVVYKSIYPSYPSYSTIQHILPE